ncbi:type II toxin-antitoxin system death-on-curing family toxin [Hydrogenophaga sp.]|uniref:type II toxin-antitoxin system death-on-curing family toxin n=1 Tax=Hydrogenophaga sp. TaxID=1904254 RepID=UPI0025C4178A|nr:type II toxin-antitoxin system death-on-curing family toxin [Hydrogenophaga sp.]
MTAWVWLNPQVLLAVHEAQLAEHGGAAGTRDASLFESAVSRPQNLAAYGLPDGGAPDVADLAAAYGFGISRNHPFIDGNKRTGYVAAELFLMLNGWRLEANDSDCALAMLAVAAGDLTEPAFAQWLRSHAQAKA